MSGELPKPDGIDFVPPVDPTQVAEAAALENPQVTEGKPVQPAEMQEDTHHGVSDQVADDDSTAISPETEARIEELRKRGRVGVLTEGTERPDTSHRMKNSDYDPDVIAAVNKAARLQDQQDDEYIKRKSGGRVTPKPKIRDQFVRATDGKLDEITGKRDTDGGLREYFEDPEGWEAGQRAYLKDSEGFGDERTERHIETRKDIFDRSLRDIGEKWDDRRSEWLERNYEALKDRQRGEDGYRGDLLDLYARNPEKYKSMSTEEFVAVGKEFRSDSRGTSRLASLESFGKSLEEKLPQLVEDASSITDFCSKMDEVLNSIRWDLERQGNWEDLYGFIEAVEGKETPDRDTLPDDNKTDEQKEAIRAYRRGVKARRDTEDRLYTASVHGYFRPDDFVSDLDQSPREQMKEAVERAKKITDQWVEDGQKARAKFDEKWGKAPEDKDPEPKAA